MMKALVTAIIVVGVAFGAPLAHAIKVGDKAKPFRLQGHEGV